MDDEERVRELGLDIPDYSTRRTTAPRTEA
jgi:hypothetical protein